MRLQDPDFMELPCPSSHGVGTAQSVARLHAILATQTAKHGRRLLSPRVTELLQKPLSWGLDVVYGLDGIYSYGMSLLPVVEDDEVCRAMIVRICFNEYHNKCIILITIILNQL